MSRTTNVTAAFIDLATFELLESSLYGGAEAITYFVREVQKCTWFSQIPVKLTSQSGTPSFGGTANFTVSRAADYLLGTWLRVELPSTRIHWFRLSPVVSHGLPMSATISSRKSTSSSTTSRFSPSPVSILTGGPHLCTPLARRTVTIRWLVMSPLLFHLVHLRLNTLLMSLFHFSTLVIVV